MGFSYHDNLIQFDAYSGQSILSGNFSVTALSISSGQDPSHKNNVGDVHVLDVGQSKPALTFTAGRHKTDDVANFWKRYVAPAQTSANDAPDQLNFAFVGTLALQLSNPPKTAYLPNIAMGQGSYDDCVVADHPSIGCHPETYSNWWFGGQSCQYEGNDQVRCTATDSHGAPMALHFQHKKHIESSDTRVVNQVHLTGVEWTN